MKDGESKRAVRKRAAGLIKSKDRVADHGEVFTPAWMVEAMLDLVKAETERIDSRFLEPACGDGNFLVRVLQRKLAAVELKFAKNDFERRHYALLGLMCIYGIELLPDNIAECRANLLAVFGEYLKLDESAEPYLAASYVLSQNLVHGDARTMQSGTGEPISFAEWGYLGKGKFQRRDFRLDYLTLSSAFSAKDSVFAQLGRDQLFTPTKSYLPMSISELAAATLGDRDSQVRRLECGVRCPEQNAEEVEPAVVSVDPLLAATEPDDPVPPQAEEVVPARTTRFGRHRGERVAVRVEHQPEQAILAQPPPAEDVGVGLDRPGDGGPDLPGVPLVEREHLRGRRVGRWVDLREDAGQLAEVRDELGLPHPLDPLHQVQVRGLEGDGGEVGPPPEERVGRVGFRRVVVLLARREDREPPVRDARAPTTCGEIGRFRLTTPFS